MRNFKLFFIYTILLVAFSRSSIIATLIPDKLYYGMFGIISTLMLISFLVERKFISKTMLFFIFIAFISILFNEINPYFLPLQRLGSFIILIIAIGPLLKNKSAVHFKMILYKHADVFLIIVSATSFLFYIVFGNIANDKLFTGIAISSMMLGPIAGLSTLICLDNLLKSRYKIGKGINASLMVISVLVCLLAASRGALVALVFSVLLYLIIYYRKFLLKLFWVVIILFICFIGTSSLWMPYTEGIIAKNQSRMESGNIFSNRQTMILDGVNDFSSNPVFGVGFSSMKSIEHSALHYGNGTFEPPSSWLFLLSTMGLLGFITFCSLFFPYIYRVIRSNKINSTYALKLSIVLVYFSIHMLIEGYVLSSGGFLFFYLWLCIGIAQINDTDESCI